MIYCCGEALIDMLPRTSTDGEDAFAPYAGGAVFNTAIALGRLDVPAGFFSGLSSDLFGDLLAQALSDSKVNTELAVFSDRPTTLAFVRLVDGQASYAFYDENTAGRMLTVDDLTDFPASTSALFFGGISLVGEPCGSAYEALMLRESSHHVTMIDPNIRPGFISDEPAYRARLERMISHADIVKLSDEDLRWLYGDAPLKTQAEALLATGVKLVLVTEGAHGATAYCQDVAVYIPAPTVTVADTVGAGDTFNAGVLASLFQQGILHKDRLATLERAVLETALKHAANAAAITVSRAGANPPWKDEL